MWLTIFTAHRAAHSVHVDTGTCVLGRAAGCHLVIDDPQVSMRHAQLEVVEGGAWLVDLGSTNGTFVDGRRLQARDWLAAPSEFQVGQSTVRLTADQPTVVTGSPPVGSASRGRTRTPPYAGRAARPPRIHVAGAGPVAGGDVAIKAGRDAAGRDLVIHEGLKLRTRMRSSAKTCIRLGLVLLLAGFGLLGYFVITWNNEIFAAVSGAESNPTPDLPSPVPWLPLGAVLMFAGIVLVVTGLLIPRDRIVARTGR